MSRLSIVPKSQAELALNDIYKAVSRRITSGSAQCCHVDMAAAFLRMCHAQSCGKCVPCRIGLGQLENLLEDILAGRGTMETLELIESTAKAIYDAADCAIGFEAAAMVLRGLEGFREDYLSHIEHDCCSVEYEQNAPCVSRCPANVDIPNYIALVAEGRYADAIRLIRQDNPLPSVCGYICENPCEANCRRRIIDDAVNIRGLKRFAADNAGAVPPPAVKYAPTGKRIAVIGGGPTGLTAAYFLTLMGHTVEIYEQHDKLGGMLRYGIPRYRLPAKPLDNDIEAILKLGIEVHYGVKVDRDVSYDELKNSHDAVYIAIGAQSGKGLDIPGADGRGYIRAIEMLHDLGNGIVPDFKGKSVVVVGGGNVAMDVARTSMRAGASNVYVVYRRRREDMTALPAEIEGTVAEGCELLTLMAPDSIERDAHGDILAFAARPQMVGKLDNAGRPTVTDADSTRHLIKCDIVIAAIGQGVDAKHFAELGIPVSRSGAVQTAGDCSIAGNAGVYAGGDCATGPATVIRAVAAGKVAAANIDNYLGFYHMIESDVESPAAGITDPAPRGRANLPEREAHIRRSDFENVELPMDCNTATCEARRCLRCDHYGYGTYWEDRRAK